MERDEAQRRWRMLEAICLLAVSLSLFVVIGIAGEIIVPVLIFGALYLVLAVLVFVAPGNRWIAGVAGVLALVGILANAPFLGEDLAHPESWGSFMPAIVSVIGGIGAVIAAVASYIALSPTLLRPVGLGIAGIAVVLVVFSGALWFTATDDEAQAGDLLVLAEAVEFPETLSHTAGSFGIVVENKDAFRHTFVIEGQGLKLEVPSSKTRRVEVNLPAGTYDYICDVPGHERMDGVLTVR